MNGRSIPTNRAENGLIGRLFCRGARDHTFTRTWYFIQGDETHRTMITGLSNREGLIQRMSRTHRLSLLSLILRLMSAREVCF